MENTSKIKLKPGALLAPLPVVLVSCGNNDNANIITIGWTGIISTIPPYTYISVRKERYSYEIIKNAGEFTINIPSQNMAKSVDLCGMKSGKKIDKFKVCNFTKENGEKVSCPAIKECKLNLECKIKDELDMGSHQMFIAEIVNVTAAPELMDKKGRLCLEKASLIAYSHGEYYAVGKKLGAFGCSVRKKK